MDAPVKQIHGVELTMYDNLGSGWRMQCCCGFMTAPYDSLEFLGAEMDEHFFEMSGKE